MLKKFMVSIFLLFVLCHHGYTQWQTSKTVAAGICVGPSFPLGVFGEKEYTDDLPRAGLAERGLGFKAYIRKKLHQNVGLNANFSGVFNPLYDKGLKEIMPHFPNTSNITIEYTNWHYYTFLAGIAAIIELSPSELDLDFKAQTGYCHAYSPEIVQQVTFTGGEVEDFPREDKKSKGAIPINIGIGLNYYISPQIVFTVDADLFGTEPVFPRDDNTTVIEFRDMYINTINVMFGMGYRF